MSTGPANLTREDHLIDLETRLKGRVFYGQDADGTAVPVYRSRAHPLSPDRLPAINLYAPDENQDRIGTGFMQAEHTLTLSVDIKVAWKDGALTCAWDAAAMRLTEQVKTALFGDSDWLRRWKRIGSVSVRQYIDDRVREHIHCGEILTMSLTPVRPQVWVPSGPPLTAVHIEARPRRNAAPPAYAMARRPEDEKEP